MVGTTPLASLARLVLFAALAVLVVSGSACTAGDPSAPAGAEEVAEIELALCNPGDCTGCCECINAFCRDQNSSCSPVQCKVATCSGCGCSYTNAPNDTGCSPDTNPCTDDKCANGSCTHPAKQNGEPCPNGRCYGGACCAGCWNGSSCQTGSATGACGTGGGACANCDDGNECKADSCVGGACVRTNVSDGQSCASGAGRCYNGSCCQGCWDGTACQMGTSLAKCGAAGAACANCNDGNDCKTDSCTAGACTRTNVPDNASCMGGTGTCHGGACCTGCWNGSACAQGNAPGACGKNGGACSVCNDNKPCTSDTCNAGACAYPAVTNGVSCADSDLCDGQETCQGGNCANGTPLDCNDGKVCTDDSCVPATGCAHSNNTVRCSDGSECTNNDTCSGGQCRGTTINCDDNEPCTTDTCNPMTGCVRTNRANGADCDDGNPCSTASACTAGRCLTTAGLDCNDDKVCTKNTCSGGVCQNPNEPNDTACEDQDACTETDKCAAGVCTGTPKNCDDDNPCTTDSCDKATGCKRIANDAADCSDGDACTEGDHCSNKACTGTPKTCAPIDECHDPGTCSPMTGQCAPGPAKADTSPCTGGQCVGGACMPIGSGGSAGSAGSAGSPGSGGDGSGATGGGGAFGNGGSASEAGAGGAPGGASGASGSRGSGARDGGLSADDPYVRHPGGCACRSATSPGIGGHWAALAGVSLLLTRRSRRRDR
jgi:hypothetical protein